LSSGRDLAEMLTRSTKDFNSQMFAQLLSMFNRRTTPQTDDEAVPRHVVFADLLDIHDQTKTLSGIADIIQTESELLFDPYPMRAFYPTTSLLPFDHTVDISNATGVTFPKPGNSQDGSGAVTSLGTRFHGGAFWDGGSHIEIPYNAGSDLDLEFSDALSIAMYVYADSSIGTGNDTIIGNRAGTGASDDGWNVYFRENDDQIRYEMSDGTNQGEIRSAAITRDAWHSIVFTKNTSGTRANWNMYVDKSNAGSSTSGSDISATIKNTDPTRIGADTGGGQDLATGFGLAWLTVIGAEVNQAWVDNYHAGLIDFAGGNQEILLFPFDGHLNSMTKIPGRYFPA